MRYVNQARGIDTWMGWWERTSISPEAIVFFEASTCYDRASHRIEAHVGPILAGLFYYRIAAECLHAFGTWVEPSFRERGIALGMWDKAVKVTGCSRFCATAVSVAGEALVTSVTKRSIGRNVTF